MNPISLSEHLMYITVKINTEDGVGTGSFFVFTIDDKKIPVIITNQHVINYDRNKTVTLSIHICRRNSEPDDNINVEYSTNWIFHKTHDLCFCYAQPIFEYIEHTLGYLPFFKANDENLIPLQKDLEELSAVEETIMVGYPIGLSDERNNLPIFRRGYTACHPSIDFNRNDIGLVDMACFPGSSGSPIYILNEGSYKIKNGDLIAGDRLILLGFLVEAPFLNANGTISVENIPTAQRLISNTQVMINLGYYIKSSVLFDFRELIKKELTDIKG